MLDITVEDIVNFIKSILIVISIPLSYIQTRKVTLDKALILIDEVSKILLNRIYKGQLVSRKELKGIIKSKSYSLKISPRTVLIDDIVNELVKKVEEIPFITKRKRRQILEKMLLLREGKESKWLKLFLFLKENERRLLTFFVVSILCIGMLFPKKWTIFRSLDIENQILIEVAIGILGLGLLILISMGMNKLFYPKINWGLVRIKHTTFSKLPDFYDEQIVFQIQDEAVKFQMNESSLSEKKKLVETDPGCIYFGIAKFYKKHQKYLIEFSGKTNNDDIELVIGIENNSFVNGSIDLDFIKYGIKISDDDWIEFYVPFSSDENGKSFIENQLNFNSKIFKKKSVYREYRSVILFQNEENLLVLRGDRTLIGFEINNVFWLLK